MADNYYVTAVIVAAGNASRMNRDKITLPISGIPCICRTLTAFEKAETVNEIIVVTRSDLVSVIEAYAEEYKISKFSKAVVGGGCRQESAVRGFLAANERCDFVSVHDGARPLILPEEIDEVNRSAFEFGCAISAVKVKDTVKIVDTEGFVEKTLDRSKLVSVSTPQTFSKDAYSEMISRFDGSLDLFTDDSSMAEALGKRVKLVYCSYSNIKITTIEDIPFAEGLLKG